MIVWHDVLYYWISYATKQHLINPKLIVLTIEKKNQLNQKRLQRPKNNSLHLDSNVKHKQKGM